MTQEQKTDRKDLKIQALVEKIASLTANYENAIADMRVDITYLNETVSRLSSQLEKHKDFDVPQDENTTDTTD